MERAQTLRYGENPHQQGARYRIEGRKSWWDEAVQHGGKELSYLNLFDTEAAWRLANSYASPAVVVVKHANPCGVAVADDIATAYVRANACDPVSAFGGIVAANRTVTLAMAEALAPVFTEVVVAPDFEADALVPSVLASVVSYSVSYTLLGTRPFFGHLPVLACSRSSRSHSLTCSMGYLGVCPAWRIAPYTVSISSSTGLVFSS